MPLQSNHVHGHEAGPADAVDRNPQSSNAREDADSTLPREDDEHFGGAGVGIIDGSGETLEDPIVLWDNALRNQKIIEELEAASLRAEKTALSSGSRADAAAAAHKQKHAEAVKAAVQALRKLASQDAQAVLRKFDLLYHGDEPNILHIGHEEKLLSKFSPTFWSHCFIHLFSRGDCAERDRRRQLGPYSKDLGQWGKRWADCLVRRADYTGWRLSVDLIATLYNILLRRDQMRAVHIEVSKLTSREVELLSQVSADDILNAARASGDCDTLRKILRVDGLNAALKSAFRHMQTAQRNVRGSEASKTSLQNKFTAVRLWSGCSSLFFTLNPYARQPLTLALCNQDYFRIEHFSLDLSDVGMTEFFAGVKQTRPRLLHEIAAQDPVAGGKFVFVRPLGLESNI